MRFKLAEGALPPANAPVHATADDPLSQAAERYREIFAGFAEGEPAPAKAPVPDDLDRRAQDIKGGAYFMDASQVGICAVPDEAWFNDVEHPRHAQAVVILVEHPATPKDDPLAAGWISGALPAIADMRAAEIAACIAGHIRKMGFAARAHLPGETLVDLERLAVLSGVALRAGDQLHAPYIGQDFAISAVSTDYGPAGKTPRFMPMPRAQWAFATGGASTARSPAANAGAVRAARPTPAATPWNRFKRV